MIFYIEKNTKKENRINCISVKIVNKIAYLFAIMVLFSLNSCQKDDAVPSPTVEILLPAASEIFLLPGEVKIHLKVKSEQAVQDPVNGVTIIGGIRLMTSLSRTQFFPQ